VGTPYVIAKAGAANLVRQAALELAARYGMLMAAPGIALYLAPAP
jgi:hypothetical protein